MNRVTWVSIGVALALALAGCGGGGTKTVTVVTVTASSSASGSGAGSGTSSTAGPATSSTTAATTTTTQASATTSATPSAPAVHLTQFESPSGNIGCIVLDGTARCDIRQRDWSPPPHPSSCPNEVDFGQGLVVGGSGTGQLVCAGDTALDPQDKKLSYGSESAAGKFRCASATTGMTCTNTATGHGFFISIQSYRVF